MYRHPYLTQLIAAERRNDLLREASHRHLRENESGVRPNRRRYAGVDERAARARLCWLVMNGVLGSMLPPIHVQPSRNS
jgi:hypothetical protein